MLTVAWINCHLIRVIFCLNCLVFPAVLKITYFCNCWRISEARTIMQLTIEGLIVWHMQILTELFALVRQFCAVPLRFLELEDSLSTPLHSLGQALHHHGVFWGCYFAPPSCIPINEFPSFVSGRKDSYREIWEWLVKNQGKGRHCSAFSELSKRLHFWKCYVNVQW